MQIAKEIKTVRLLARVKPAKAGARKHPQLEPTPQPPSHPLAYLSQDFPCTSPSFPNLLSTDSQVLVKSMFTLCAATAVGIIRPVKWEKELQ